MANGFDVMPVGIEHEYAVVVRVIVRAQTRSAVVPATRSDHSLVESVDLRPRLSPEGNVNGRLVGTLLPDPEVGLGRDAEARELLPFHQQLVAERRQRGAIERFAQCDIGNGEARMIDHAATGILSLSQTKCFMGALCTSPPFIVI